MAVIVAAWAALLLVALGALVPGAGLAAGTSVSWLWWCYRHRP